METPSDRVREKWREHAREWPLLIIDWQGLLAEYEGDFLERVNEKQQLWSGVLEDAFELAKETDIKWG